MTDDKRYRQICDVLRHVANPAGHPLAREACEILLRTAKRLLARYDVEAEDILHDLVIVKFRELVQADGLGLAGRALANRAKDAYRRARREEQRDRAAADAASLWPARANLEDEAANREILAKLLGRLSEPNADLAYRLLVDEPREDIARALGCTRDTLDRRVSRLLAAMRAELVSLEAELGAR